MSSFLLQKQQIHCNCFQNSPQNERNFFKSDSGATLNRNIEESHQMQPQMKNNSEQRKIKKKSLKKEKPAENPGSQKNQKDNQEAQNNSVFPELPALSGAHQIKKQNNRVYFDAYFDQSHLIPIKFQRSKPIHSSRQQKPQALFQPLLFQIDPIKQPRTPTQINSQRMRKDEEFEKKINQQFEKDLRQMRQAMEKVEQQNQKSKNAINKKRKQSLLVDKSQLLQAITLSDPTHDIRYFATQQIIPETNHHQFSSKAITFRNSEVSKKQKIPIKKENKIQPRQIESLRDSKCSSDDSDKFSEVVGRGWDGLTTIRVSTCEISEDNNQKEKGGLETMTTQQSHIKSSNIQTFSEFSNIITSPKSMIQRGMEFGGGHKYGLTGMSFQQLNSVGQPKCTGSSKFIF